jgi:hypothetical protein
MGVAELEAVRHVCSAIDAAADPRLDDEDRPTTEGARAPDGRGVAVGTVPQAW